MVLALNSRIAWLKNVMKGTFYHIWILPKSKHGIYLMLMYCIRVRIGIQMDLGLENMIEK